MLHSFKRWTTLIVNFISTYFNDMSISPSQMQRMQESWKYYLRKVRMTKGAKLLTESDSSQSNKGEDSDISSPLQSGAEYAPFPIVVVGFNHTQVTLILQNTTSSSSANSSASNINDLLQVNKFKDLIGKLRYYCLDLGMALLLIPSLTDNTITSNDNLPLLKKYVMHRLFPEQIGMDLSVEVIDFFLPLTVAIILFLL